MRLLKRLIAYPLFLLLSALAFIGAGLLAARVSASSEVAFAAGLAGAFVLGFLIVSLIERRSAARRALSLVLPFAVTAAIGAGMWLYAAQPLRAGPPAAAESAASGVWTLADGGAISFIRCGAAREENSRPLVFLHGGPAIPPRAATIASVCAIGARGFDVYLYDQMGSGASSRLDDISGYSVARHVSDLEEIRIILGAEQIDVIGVSWGTVLASHYIAAHPGRVAHGVFVSPGVLGPRDGDDVEYDFAPTASSDSDAVLLPPLRVIVAGLLARVNSRTATDFMSQEEAGPVMDAFAAHPGLDYQVRCKGATIEPHGPTRAGGANYYANLMTAQDLRRVKDPAADIRRDAPPVLLIHGACDYIPRSALGRYEAAFPDAAILDVKGEGHSFLGSRPDIVVPAAVCLLEGASPKACAS